MVYDLLSPYFLSALLLAIFLFQFMRFRLLGSQKCSYDHKRWFFYIGFAVFSFMSKWHNFQYHRDAGVYKLTDYNSMSSFLIDHGFLVLILGHILLLIIVFISDFVIFGRLTEKGILLDRYIAFKNMIGYQVDSDFNWIDIEYRTAFSKIRRRIIKSNEEEIRKIKEHLDNHHIYLKEV